VRLARPRVSRRRNRREGLRGVGRVPGVHRPGGLGIVGGLARGLASGLASGRLLQPRGRPVQLGERALAPGTAPDQSGGGPGRVRAGETGAGGPARTGPARARLTGTRAASAHAATGHASRAQAARAHAASRTRGLTFGAQREDASWRSHPVLGGARGVHPRQFADRLLSRFPGRMTGRPGSAHRVQPVRGAERPHRLRRGVTCPAQGRVVCVCAAAQRGIPARRTARRTVAA
jgi:hypothetical protein